MALSVLTGASSAASSRADDSRARPAPQWAVPERAVRAPVRLAQASDPSIRALQEEVRRLNGRVEELNFQILQMQDEIRRMKEDNEFRFQQLEDKRSEADGGAASKQARPAPSSEPSDPADPAPQSTAAGPETEPGTGEPPRALGDIRFDAAGNIIGDGGEPVDLVGEQDGQSGGGEAVAALPSSSSPAELYRNSYELILNGDYQTAEAGFREHIERYPDAARASDAHFWLGESLLGQDRYQEAAEVFLRASRQYPDSEKGPDMLLKLGISLAAMNQRDVACATYGEIGQRYPDVSGALQERVQEEQALAGC